MLEYQNTKKVKNTVPGTYVRERTLSMYEGMGTVKSFTNFSKNIL